MALLDRKDDAMQRGLNASHDLSDIAPHRFRLNPQHAITEPSRHAVPPRIRRTAPFMRPIIHFNYKPGCWCEEIQDVPVSGHLATKSDAELLTGNSAPKTFALFRSYCGA